MRLLAYFLIAWMLSACASSKPPLVEQHTESTMAEIRLYSARALGWRQFFAVHTWIAYRKSQQDHFTSLHFMRRVPGQGESGIYRLVGDPSYYWSDGESELLLRIRGPKLDLTIDRIIEAAAAFDPNYLVWPGPNSNTFTAHLIKSSQKIYSELPPHALGKDYIAPWGGIDATTSGTGFQINIFNLAGFTLGLDDGIELQVLGLVGGIDFWPPAVKLPLVGRLGWPISKDIVEH